MCGPRLTESSVRRAGLAVIGLALSCSSAPRISPWGPGGAVPLRLYAETPDLDARGRTIDGETAALGLELDKEIAFADRNGTRYLVRSYVGHDSLGRPTHACRIASPLGVVLAVGPESETDSPDTTTELVRALDTHGGRAVSSPADLDGDGSFEVILRSRSGTLSIASLGPNGARDMAIALAGPVRGFVDLGADGVAPSSVVSAPDDAPLRPHLVDVATGEDGAFSNKTRSARAFHARERDLAVAPKDALPKVRAERALEHAWHAILAGDSRDGVLDMLDHAEVGADLRPSFQTWAAKIRALTR